jgi:hypothetical protein
MPFEPANDLLIELGKPDGPMGDRARQRETTKQFLQDLPISVSSSTTT